MYITIVKTPVTKAIPEDIKPVKQQDNQHIIKKFNFDKHYQIKPGYFINYKYSIMSSQDFKTVILVYDDKNTADYYSSRK